LIKETIHNLQNFKNYVEFKTHDHPTADLLHARSDPALEQLVDPVN